MAICHRGPLGSSHHYHPPGETSPVLIAVPPGEVTSSPIWSCPKGWGAPKWLVYSVSNPKNEWFRGTPMLGKLHISSTHMLKNYVMFSTKWFSRHCSYESWSPRTAHSCPWRRAPVNWNYAVWGLRMPFFYSCIMSNSLSTSLCILYVYIHIYTHLYIIIYASCRLRKDPPISGSRS